MKLKDLFKDSLKNLGLYMPPAPLWARPLSANSSFCRAVVANGMLGNLNVIFSFCREINGEKKNFCLVTNPRKKLKYRMFTEAES